MKYLASAFCLIASFSASNALALSNSCGVREVAKAAATIDMELDLLASGLYNVVRNESMVYIANIVKDHLVRARMCDFQSERLRRRAIASINSQVINNEDLRPYSIDTATRLFYSFKNDVNKLESSADDFLSNLINDKAEELIRELAKRTDEELR